MIEPALRALAGDGAPLDTDLAKLRADSDRLGRDTAGEPIAGLNERDARIEVQHGAEIGLRILRATDAAAAAPTVVYFHGGGWATGSVDGYATIARNLARFSGGTVVAVDYRLAPEHRFPGPLDDCVAAARWVQDHAGDLALDASRIVLAGDSAGAHLALLAALALRDAGQSCAAVLAFYPCLDPACATPSWEDLGRGHYLTRERMRWYWRALLGAAADRPSPAMTPWLRDDLADLPPVWIMVAEHDPLRDEGQALAHDLRASGVPVGYELQPGMLHGFLRWRALVPHADDAVQHACDWLREQLPLACGAVGDAA